MWDRLTRITEPVSAAVLLADAKLHLREDTTANDALIERLVATAAAMIDGPDGIGYALQPQEWRLTLDAFTPPRHPHSARVLHYGRIRLPIRPVTAITQISYTDPAGDAQTLDAADYHLSIAGGTATLTPVTAWPGVLCEPGAVRIDFEAGTGTPPALHSAILMMVSHLFENRSAAVAGPAVQAVPLGWSALIEPYRMGRVAI